MTLQYKTRVIVHDGDEMVAPFAYLQVNKVACTSVKTAIAPLFGMDPAKVQRERKARYGPRFLVHRLFNRSEHQISLEQLADGLEDLYAEHFKFAFVRNPFDRLLSCWSDKIAGGRDLTFLNLESKRGIARGMPFEEFVSVAAGISDEDANPHFRSQLVDLSPTRDSDIIPDFVGRFESLTEDFRTVCQKIGAPNLELPHRLRSEGREGKHYREFYDQRTRRLAAERFAADLELFGYSF